MQKWSCESKFLNAGQNHFPIHLIILLRASLLFKKNNKATYDKYGHNILTYISSPFGVQRKILFLTDLEYNQLY